MFRRSFLLQEMVDHTMESFNIFRHLRIILGIPLAFLDYTTDKPPHNDHADENPMAVSQRRTVTNSDLPALSLSEGKFPDKLL